MIFGLGFLVLMPPCQTPDENAHFLRAYHVSEGHLVPTMVDGCGGGEMPLTILYVAAPFGNLPLQPDNQTRLGCFSPLISLPLLPQLRRAVPFPNSTYYSFVPYVPQAVGHFVARTAGAGPLAIFYAGRLANLAFCVFVIFWAIRLTPVFKLTFGMVALIPMTVHQLASHSPDASTIAVGFLLSALFLRVAVVPGPRLSVPMIAALFAVSAWMILCKFPYAVMTLLYLAIPVERLGDRRRYYGVGFALMLLALGLVLAEMQFKDYTADGIPLPQSSASIAGQLEFITHHPLGYAKVMAATTAEHGKIWMDQLGFLGWLDVFVNPLAMQVLFLFVLLVALGDHDAGLVPSQRLRLIAGCTAVLCGVVILTAVYICGCPVRAKLIVGIQGRYFLPIAPLLLLPLSNRLIEVRTRPGFLLALVAGVGSGILLVALLGALRRYYFPPLAQLWMAPLALALGTLLSTVIAYAMGRQPRLVEKTQLTATSVVVEDTAVVSRGLVEA
jgi:hypothetical protein